MGQAGNDLRSDIFLNLIPGLSLLRGTLREQFLEISWLDIWDYLSLMDVIVVVNDCEDQRSTPKEEYEGSILSSVTACAAFRNCCESIALSDQ